MWEVIERRWLGGLVFCKIFKGEELKDGQNEFDIIPLHFLYDCLVINIVSILAFL